MSKQRQRADKGTLKKVLRYLAPYRLLIGLSILLSAGSVALTLYVPIVLGQAIDLIVGEGQVDFAGVGRLLLRVALAVGATALMPVADGHDQQPRHLPGGARRAQGSLRPADDPAAFLPRRAPGRARSSAGSSPTWISSADGLLMGFTQLFTGVLTILGTLGFMLSIRPGIALVVVLLTPLSLVVAPLHRAAHLRSCSSSSPKSAPSQTALIDEMIGNQKVVKAFGREARSLADV